jgi:hypothetical protein
MSIHDKKAFAKGLPRNLPRALREKIEAAIEQHHEATEANQRAFDSLVAVLDDADGDEDFQEDPADPTHGGIDDNELDGPEFPDDEPELGCPEMMNQVSALKSVTGCLTLPGGSWTDLNSTGEPSLASPEPGSGSQVGWARGDRFDREVQCEDEGHDSDREPACEDEGTDETQGVYAYHAI